MVLSVPMCEGRANGKLTETQAQTNLAQIREASMPSQGSGNSRAKGISHGKIAIATGNLYLLVFQEK